MSDEKPFNEEEISDVDTARLALRGAVSTLRTLQDLVGNLKAENQELGVREKAWKTRVETMEQRLSEIHAKWQESQTLIQNYKHEIAGQMRNEIIIEEQQKWKAQIDQVQSTLQERQIRVTGKKRDDLQTVIQFCRSKDFEVGLAFKNFRD